MKTANISELLGKVLTSVTNTGDELVFVTNSGETYKMYHDQDCCESVTIEDICGDLADLIGSPILEAKEVTNSDNPKYDGEESFLWTFYKIGTLKGCVTIRWYGSSNGNYSESVSFRRVGE